MGDELISELPEVTRLALTSARSARQRWLAAFVLDARLSRIVASTGEPMLAQMRLAWWRDQLNKAVETRPMGDHLLDLIGTQWVGHEEALLKVVDGWEALLSEPTLTRQVAHAFANGRSAIFVPFGPEDKCLQQSVESEGRLWALADLAVKTSQEAERRVALDLAVEECSDRTQLPPALRPLTVLAGLAARSIKRGGTPLLGDRLSPIVALRLGLIGR